jgi:hypothetical protein
MTDLQIVFACVARGAACVLLLALFVRGLSRVFLSFTLYLACSLVYNVLGMDAPDVFWTLGFWLADRLICFVLKMALLIELSRELLRAFPGARITMQHLLVLLAMLLIVTTIGTLVIIPGGIMGLLRAVSQTYLAFILTSRLSLDVAIGFIALWTVTIWYHLPVQGLHQALIRSLAFLSIVQSVCFTMGLNDRLVVLGSHLEQAAFTLMASYCAWAILRPSGHGRSVPARAIVRPGSGPATAV